jgi:hypothetical protein
MEMNCIAASLFLRASSRGVEERNFEGWLVGGPSNDMGVDFLRGSSVASNNKTFSQGAHQPTSRGAALSLYLLLTRHCWCT